MFPVLETQVGIIRRDIFNKRAVHPREGQVLALAGEVIFDVAVGANHGAHLLAREGTPVLPLGLEGFLQGRVGDHQVHRRCLVAVCATNGVVELGRHLGEQHFIVGCHAHLSPQPGVIRAFTRVAGGVSLGVDALDAADIFQRVLVAALFIVFQAERVSGKQLNQAGVVFQPGKLF